MNRFNLIGIIFTATLFSLVIVACGTLSADDVPLLRYGFAAGKEYAFQVKIQAETENYDEIREGVLTYKVVSVTEKEIVLKPSGSLGVQIKPHANTAVLPRPPMFGMMGPRGFMGPGGPQNGIKLNKQGEKLVSQELTSLPYLLGDMEMLVIEEFPAEAKTNWERHRDVQIVEESSGPFPRFGFGGRGLADGKHTSAKEQINYTILKTDKDAIEISKKYSLLASPEGDNQSRFEMTGDGQFTFNPGEGLIKTFSMKYECRENEKNVSRKYPITVMFNSMTSDELAAHKKKLEENKAAAAAALKKRTEVQEFDAGERATLLKDLKSTDKKRVKDAADRLAKAPVDDHPADISKALVALLRNSDRLIQRSAANALVIWATPDAESALIKVSQNDDVFLQKPIIQALGKCKTPKAAQAVAKQMRNAHCRDEVEKALKEMGPIAEDATIECLGDQDLWGRAKVCLVLQEIGGKKSITALLNMIKQLGSDSPREAQPAIAAIMSRMESEQETTSDADGTKTKSEGSSDSVLTDSTTGMRTWRDASGTFSVEAVMLSQKDGKVVLQKKDGKTITVNVGKLSPADKKYVADHPGEPAKAENPFD